MAALETALTMSLIAMAKRVTLSTLLLAHLPADFPEFLIRKEALYRGE